MPDLLKDSLGVVWRILLAIPMPWRAGMITWVVALVGYQVVYLLLILLLFPEFLLTNRLRRWKLRPFPGTYIFDDVIGWAIRLFNVLKWALLVASVLGIIGWYIRPFLTDATSVQYIDQFTGLWQTLEQKIEAGS